MSGERGMRRVVTGKVVSDAMDKTITVRQDRLVRHALYGKTICRATTYKAHDENNSAHEGDVVEITVCRPMSKTKNWRLVRIVRSDFVAEEA